MPPSPICSHLENPKGLPGKLSVKLRQQKSDTDAKAIAQQQWRGLAGEKERANCVINRSELNRTMLL